MLPHPPSSTLFPYTTLFRSAPTIGREARFLSDAGEARERRSLPVGVEKYAGVRLVLDDCQQDRKSTRLNSSHSSISYAVFCLKKKDRQAAAVEVVQWQVVRS